MCGIFCICAPNLDSEDVVHHLLSAYKCIKPMLDRRGPDYRSYRTTNLHNHTFVFSSSVLWLQGNEITKQPVESEQSIFVYNGDIFGGIPITHKDGDTLALLNLLQKSTDIVSDLSKLQGPYAFIYLNKERSVLYFGRDHYGRRSLLIGCDKNALLLSSVAKKSLQMNCIELPAVGIFSYDLQSHNLQLHPWHIKHANFMDKVHELEKLMQKKIYIKNINYAPQMKFTAPSKEDLSFFKQLDTSKSSEVFEKLLTNPMWFQKVKHLQQLLEIAVEKRITTQPKFCHDCITQRNSCTHSITGVLFSGGIDCAVLALLADKYTHKNCSIDLLNVAFNSNTPDRATGLETLKELQQLKPERVWNFIELNVEENELNLERNRVIADLIYPLNTILDDSLGCALWFASRGQSDDYTSPCRVLLVGMGADELFGGYTKHRAALKRDDWMGLYKSLESDWENISFRNLARDDRVVSDHGRQLRTPYLDENLVNFVRNLNCWERTCPTDYLPQGIGEKILLRSLAYYLGLQNASAFKKRALQFGSRIANSKENAHDVSPRLC